VDFTGSRTLDTALITFLVVLGSIVLSIPVAFVYMLTKRLRFDPGLVRSVIILPIAVAGILLVVKHSLAIAFSLAGIVAAVRFRNTLKDPRDAVYIFLTIAIGIAAGVQALDVALVVSFVFNVVVILLWKFQFGSIYGGRYGRTGVMSVGDTSLLVAQTPDAIRSVRRKLVGEGADMKTDGILLVHSQEPEMARNTVQDALSMTAREWRLMGIWPRGGEISTAEYLVRLAKDTTPADLIGELDEWSLYIPAAEYIPFRQRDRARKTSTPEPRWLARRAAGRAKRKRTAANGQTTRARSPTRQIRTTRMKRTRKARKARRARRMTRQRIRPTDDTLSTPSTNPCRLGPE
jgi:hypothetical protein